MHRTWRALIRLGSWRLVVGASGLAVLECSLDVGGRWLYYRRDPSYTINTGFQGFGYAFKIKRCITDIPASCIHRDV